MADFISKELQKQTVAPETYNSKIKLTKKEVNLQFLETRDVNGDFRITYIVSINTKGRKSDPKREVKFSDYDQQSLKEGIVSNIPAYDSKYLDLAKFDDRKAIFVFNYKKWLKDATRGIKGKTHFSKFDREFRFKIQPPKEIKKDRLSYKFEEFITRKFLDWLEDKSRLQKEYFKYLIPAREQKKIRTKMRNMFEWHYDSQWNKMVAKLKTIYIVALMYATGKAVQKLKQRNINKSQKELFATKVQKNIDTFDKKKWEDFTKRKFF